MRISRPFLNTVTAFCICLLLAGAAMANPVGGTATLSFQQTTAGVTPGTASGFFVFDPASGTITSWDITTTASSNGAYGTRTYNSADVGAAASVIILSNTNGDEVLSFEENFNEFGSNERDEFDIVVACAGTANCVNFGAVGASYAIVGGPAPCAPGALKCIPSGEQFNVPSFGGERFLASGFFNVSDPPGSTLAFNIDTVATGTIYNGGTGSGNNGGGGTGVPEPSMILLFGSSVGGFALRQLKLRK